MNAPDDKYYATIIPNTVFFNDSYSATAKELIGIFVTFYKNGDCINIGNKWLSIRLGKSKRTISRGISELAKHKLIKIKLKVNTHNANVHGTSVAQKTCLRTISLTNKCKSVCDFKSLHVGRMQIKQRGVKWAVKYLITQIHNDWLRFNYK